MLVTLHFVSTNTGIVKKKYNNHPLSFAFSESENNYLTWITL